MPGQPEQNTAKTASVPHVADLTRATQRRNVRNEQGTVVIKIVLVRRSNPVRGNIVRSFTVRDAQVSDVAARIEAALFAATPVGPGAP